MARANEGMGAQKKRRRGLRARGTEKDVQKRKGRLSKQSRRSKGEGGRLEKKERRKWRQEGNRGKNPTDKRKVDTDATLNSPLGPRYKGKKESTQKRRKESGEGSGLKLEKGKMGSDT